MNRELNEPPFSGPGWKVSAERDFFLAHLEEASRHLGEAFRLAEGLSVPYVQRMIGDAMDLANEARGDVVAKGWF